jgi:peptide/nickel transport system substrate-binding protein
MTPSTHTIFRALLAVAMASPIAAFAGKANNTLTYASDSEVANVSPYHNNMREGVIIAHMVWDTLAFNDPKSGEYKPQLATSWKWENPTSLLMTLRKGVTFHNGDKFSADDVVFTLNYVVSPESKAVTRANTNWIKSAEKVDDYTVRIHLKAPFPAALEYLSGPVPIYPGAYFNKVGLEGFSKAPVGTGPYKISAINPGQGVTMTRFANYYKDSPLGQPSIQTVKFLAIPDPQTRIAQLMTGEVDWIWRVPSDQADSLKDNPEITILSGETMRVGFLSIDSQGTSSANSPLKDLRVRQAINHAINRPGIAKNLIRGGSQPVYAPCFRTQVACETKNVVKYDYNPAKAKELLTQAGFPNGFETDLYAYRDRDYAEAIIGDLQKVGIKVRLHYQKFPAMQPDFRAGKTPMTFQAWGSFSVNDASAFVGQFFKGGDDDLAKDKQVQDWLAAGDATVDAKVRSQHYEKALERISKQAYWAPMFSYSISYAFNSALNFKDYPDELPRFYEASWK